MYGGINKRINLYLRTSLTESLINVVKDDNATDWKLFSVSLPTCSNQFQLVVEGVRGSLNTSVIAIDDFRFVNCEYKKPQDNEQCDSVNKFKCSSNHCVERTSICGIILILVSIFK
jgi:hypothetical protein